MGCPFRKYQDKIFFVEGIPHWRIYYFKIWSLFPRIWFLKYDIFFRSFFYLDLGIRANIFDGKLSSTFKKNRSTNIKVSKFCIDTFEKIAFQYFYFSCCFFGQCIFIIGSSENIDCSHNMAISCIESGSVCENSHYTIIYNKGYLHQEKCTMPSTT